MKYDHPLRQILSRTLSHWDRDETRPSVRRAFHKAMQCRTPALGAEVFVSPNQELILYHTCKSRACPSCGYRANTQWLRERWAALPDAPYKGITFTMPDLLWPFFHDNPALAKALPTLAAEVIKTRVSVKYGLRVGVIAILHTFNGQLKFNSHVHTMVTGGGLHRSSGTWAPHVYYDHDYLTRSWRKAVIALLRAALGAGQIRTELTVDQMEDLLSHLERCWWSVRIQSFEDKWHFLQYAGRYVSRPPIAQGRITSIGERTVRFWYKDKKLHRRRVEVQCSLEEFIDRWAQHIPEHYQHAVRSFGLFAPRSLAQTCAAIFAILGQERKPRPKRRPWADSIKRDFGHDPLLDDKGQQMRRVRRLNRAGGTQTSVNVNGRST
jgi:Putative transposase/Transposase zinc-binding domain